MNACRKFQFEHGLKSMKWKINAAELHFKTDNTTVRTRTSDVAAPTHWAKNWLGVRKPDVVSSSTSARLDVQLTP